MRIRAKAWALCLGLPVLLLASHAAAATICVTPPTVTSCPNHTIAAAVAIAHPLDTISIAGGTYYENVTIPAGLDGLKIQGAGKTATILDAGDNTLLGIAGHFAGLTILSRNVTVKNMTVRNGSFGIMSGADNTIVSGVNFTGSSVGIYFLDSYKGSVTLSEFHDLSAGVYVATTLGVVISKNTFTNAKSAVASTADGTQVLSNKISNGMFGIYVPGGDGTVVKSNVLSYLEVGILITGASPTVQLNKISGTRYGIEGFCINCFGGSIAQNTVTDATAIGIVVAADAPGLNVQNNTIVRAGVGIMSLNASAPAPGVFITSNIVSDTGNTWAALDASNRPGNVNSGHCIAINGDKQVVSKNVLKACGGSGIYVNGNDNTLDANVITATFENGITIDGCNSHDSGAPTCDDAPFSGNYLNANRSTLNGGQGIALIYSADSTWLQFNSATLNAKNPAHPTTDLNFCDSSDNGTVFYSNSFADPGGPVPCYTVH